jgi:glycosyltransferase involved in cell wall biosynthesis
MKIAFVNQPWDSIIPPVQAGSIPIWNYEVARRLVKHCDVIIYARKNPGQKAVEFYEKVEYRRVSVALGRFFNGISKLWANLSLKNSYFASIFYGFSYAVRVAIDLRRQKCDVVHIPNFSQFVPIIRAFNPNIKIILHMHCEWLTQVNHKLIAKRLSQVDLIIGCSDYITKKIESYLPQFSELCHTVFNGVDLEQFISNNNNNQTKPNDSKKLLFVGRISPEKGLHILLDAFEIVIKYYPQAYLEIVGPQKPTPTEFLAALSDDPNVAFLTKLDPKNYFSYLQNKLSLKIASQVFFSGSVKHLELVDCYRKADILINPSVSEAFGMSLVEAMATGIPVIATRVGGMIDVVEEGKTGLLVEANNASALAEAIIHLLADRELRESMGRAGRQRALELFSWDKITESLLSNYYKLCSSVAQ